MRVRGAKFETFVQGIESTALVFKIPCVSGAVVTSTTNAFEHLFLIVYMSPFLEFQELTADHFFFYLLNYLLL